MNIKEKCHVLNIDYKELSKCLSHNNCSCYMVKHQSESISLHKIPEYKQYMQCYGSNYNGYSHCVKYLGFLLKSTEFHEEFLETLKTNNIDCSKMQYFFKKIIKNNNILKTE